MTYQIHQRAAELRGEERGRVAGRQEAQIENAKRMLKKNLPVESVAEFSGLTISEINAIQNQMRPN